jgi:hypothetical protein
MADAVLPEEIANRIKLTFRQSGRDVEVWVFNPNSDLVITSITAALEYKAAPAQSAHLSAPGAITDFYPAPEGRSWPLELFPDKLARLSMKFGDDSVLDSLRLREVRGRELTFFEKLERYLF